MGMKLSDPSGAASDPALSTLARLLDPVAARQLLKRSLPRLSGPGRLRLKRLNVIRHKPGKRCVIEYVVAVERPDQPEHRIKLIGKVRARRSGTDAFRLQKAIWNAGFDDHSPDHVSVPEPVGVIPKLQIWFQRKVQGTLAEELLPTETGTILAGRIAEAIRKLHVAGVPASRKHLIEDELRILRDCFAQVSRSHPTWSKRLGRLMSACEGRAASVQPTALCGIHRDFYGAQVLIHKERLWLLDFDLYCLGDPGLDVGNFLGHITEFALRQMGNHGALADRESALEDRFVALSGEPVRNSVRVYADLTLARHIYLSTRFPERIHLSEQLLELCEKRMNCR